MVIAESATPLPSSDPPPPIALPHQTAAELRRRLRERSDPDWALACIVSEDGRLLGTLTPQQLLALPDERRLGEVARLDTPRIAPGTNAERVASFAIEHALSAVPVVDAQGRLLQVLGPHVLMDILRREHVQDLHRIAGISAESEHAREAFEEPPLRRARHRLPWLVAGLFGSALATLVMARFEAVLAAMPAIAFFVPALVYLADAIGTQSEAISVRGLSLSRVAWPRLVFAELRTGLLMGLALASLAFPMVWLGFGDARLATAIALSLVSASAVATGLGLALPLALHRLGADPAYGSGPIATIVQDVLTLLIYFGFVSMIAR